MRGEHPEQGLTRDSRPRELQPSRGRTITGQTNHNGNDGTVARFGWKAQNKSLLVFSGEAYNVEMGISNELFPTERDERASCQMGAVPNDITNVDALTTVEALSSIERFAHFMRFLAAPVPSHDTPGGAASIAAGRTVFDNVGCAFCHTPPSFHHRQRLGPPRCAISRSTCFPICWCTTWASGWRTGSARAKPVPANSGAPRCGGSDSACSSSTTAALRT